MLQLYSDAGQFGDVTFIATLILRDRTSSLTFFCEKHNDLSSCIAGEIAGVIQGLEWILGNCEGERIVEVYIDSLSVASVLASRKSYTPTSNQMLWMHLFNLCDKFDRILVYHVKAHQVDHNPNKTCDMLCSALLRPYKREQACMQ